MTQTMHLLLILLCFLQLDCVLSVLKEQDPYTVLGVSRRASLETIKSSYRQKAKEAHPDKNPDL